MNEIAAIAILCDSEGTIRQVLYDGVEMFAHLSAGQPFADVVDGASIEKARAFVDAVRASGAVFDWEMNVRAGEQVTSLHFSGSATAKGLFIVGAVTRSDIAHIYEQFISVNERPPSTFPDVQQLISSRNDDSDLFNELARLNNELVTVHRELIKRNVELERLSDQKNRFVGIAAHDLRNPLQIIQGYSELLLNELFGKLTADQVKVISAIQRNSDFMLKLITDLLYISQIEAGKLQLDLQETDLIALLKRSVELNRLLAEQKEIDIVFRHDESFSSMRLDPTKIEQVVNNLISNAMKFSHRNTTIEVQAIKDDGSAVISVKDQGQGIPAEEIGNLFIPFERVSVRSTAGEPSTGLGLAIVKGIVEGHGGKIRVESTVGQGSTFSFSLPFSNL